MNNEEQIYKKLIKIHKDLPKQQKKLADFIIYKYETVIGMSLKEFSKKTGASEPTIIKFSRALGFKGYADLKSNLLKYYKDNIVADANFKTDISELTHKGSYIQNMIERELVSLKEVLLTLDEKVLDRCAGKVLKAKRIFIYSGYTTKHILVYLETILAKYGFTVISVSEAGRYLYWKLAGAKKDDFVIMYKFHKATKDFQSVLKFLKESEVDSLLITNTRSPSVVKDASEYLYARRADTGYFHSMVIPLLLTDIFLNRIIEKGGAALQKRVQHFKNVRKQYYNE